MNELQPNNPEMGMKDFVAVLRRRIWVILPILLLCLAGAYEWTLKTPPTWRAETTLRLVPHAVPSGNSLGGVQAQADESIETQLGLIQSSAMAHRTLVQLKSEADIKGLSTTSVALTEEDIQNAVKVTNPADSALLYVTADATDREQARLLANAVAHAFAGWKQDDAQKEIGQSENNLNKKVATAQKHLDKASQNEMQFKQAHHLADLDQDKRLQSSSRPIQKLRSWRSTRNWPPRHPASRTWTLCCGRRMRRFRLQMGCLTRLLCKGFNRTSVSSNRSVPTRGRSTPTPSPALPRFHHWLPWMLRSKTRSDNWIAH